MSSLLFPSRQVYRPVISTACIRAAFTNKNKSFTDSFINKHLPMSWPQRKVTLWATNLEKLPSSNPMNEGPFVHQWAGNWPMGMKEGIDNHPSDQPGCWSMWAEGDSQNRGMGVSSSIWTTRGVTNIKWEFKLVMKMPQSWSDFLMVSASRSDPAKKQNKQKNTLYSFYQFGSFKNSIKCYTDVVGQV